MRGTDNEIIDFNINHDGKRFDEVIANVNVKYESMVRAVYMTVQTLTNKRLKNEKKKHARDRQYFMMGMMAMLSINIKNSELNE